MIYFNGREHLSCEMLDLPGSYYILDDSETIVELQNRLEDLATVFAPHDGMQSVEYVFITAKVMSCTYKIRVFANSAEIRERSAALGRSARRFARMSGQKKFSKITDKGSV
jgi:hypothetical protein